MSGDASKKQDQFIVRLPEGMRDKIKLAAEKSNRSMNAEIVLRLTESLRDRKEVSDDPLDNEKRFLQMRLQEVEARLMMDQSNVHQIRLQLEQLNEKQAHRAHKSSKK
jgi:hypothetical protein